MEGLNSFQPSSSLKERVYEALKTEIILGRLKAGQQLNIAELAAMMGISSAPVREALSMLCQNGFVVLTPRKKAIVAEFTMQDYDIVMELRQMLEPYAAKLSAGHIPKERIAEMRKILQNVLNKPDDMYAYVESDMALHDLIGQWCGSAIFGDLLKTIKEHSLRIRYCAESVVDEISQMTYVAVSTQEHMDILNTLEQGDPEEASQAMRTHLGNYIQRSNTQEAIVCFLRDQKEKQ